jgi:hypothetical protein
MGVPVVVSLLEDEMQNAVVDNFEEKVLLILQTDAVSARTKCYVLQVHHDRVLGDCE